MTDAEAMHRHWVTDAEVSRFWGWKPHTHIEETRRLLQGWIHDYSNSEYYHWVIILKEISEAIGYIYLNDINNDENSASIHFLLSRTYWNQGIMTEACRAVLAYSFMEIGVNTIHTYHHLDNPASGKVMQKSGMRYLKTQYRAVPDCEHISGEYCYYEMTRDDWKRSI
jgi:ribosomal-protein-alanine N-acetyltransferase